MVYHPRRPATTSTRNQTRKQSDCCKRSKRSDLRLLLQLDQFSMSTCSPWPQPSASTSGADPGAWIHRRGSERRSDDSVQMCCNFDSRHQPSAWGSECAIRKGFVTVSDLLRRHGGILALSLIHWHWIWCPQWVSLCRSVTYFFAKGITRIPRVPRTECRLNRSFWK